MSSPAPDYDARVCFSVAQREGFGEAASLREDVGRVLVELYASRGELGGDGVTELGRYVELYLQGQPSLQPEYKLSSAAGQGLRRGLRSAPRALHTRRWGRKNLHKNYLKNSCKKTKKLLTTALGIDIISERLNGRSMR